MSARSRGRWAPYRLIFAGGASPDEADRSGQRGLAHGFLDYRAPSYLDQLRHIHAIPMKKTDQAIVGYLTLEELQALLDVPDFSLSQQACASRN